MPAKRIVNTSPLVFLVRAGLVEMLRAGDHDVVVSEPVIVGLVLLAKEAGRISAARPLIRRLRESGMYLSDLVVNEALARVGE